MPATGVSTHTAPLNIAAVGAVEPVELAAGHRVAADEARIVDGGGDRALDAADVGDDAGGLGQRPLDLVGDGQHRARRRT